MSRNDPPAFVRPVSGPGSRVAAMQTDPRTEPRLRLPDRVTGSYVWMRGPAGDRHVGQGAKSRPIECVFGWRFRRHHYDLGARVEAALVAHLGGARGPLAVGCQLRGKLFLHRDRLDQSPPPHAICRRRNAAADLGQFRPPVFGFTGAVFDGVDRRQPPCSHSGGLVRRRFRAGECDLSRSPLGNDG